MKKILTLIIILLLIIVLVFVGYKIYSKDKLSELDINALIGICAGELNESIKRECYEEIFKENNDLSICKGDYSSLCYQYVAINTENPLLCQNLYQNHYCYQKVAIALRNITICELIKGDSFSKKQCYDSYRRIVMDPADLKKGQILSDIPIISCFGEMCIPDCFGEYCYNIPLESDLMEEILKVIEILNGTNYEEIYLMPEECQEFWNVSYGIVGVSLKRHKISLFKCNEEYYYLHSYGATGHGAHPMDKGLLRAKMYLTEEQINSLKIFIDVP